MSPDIILFNLSYHSGITVSIRFYTFDYNKKSATHTHTHVRTRVCIQCSTTGVTKAVVCVILSVV